MFFRQILHEDLGCASYVIAADGDAVVVDPKWEIDDYLTAAADADSTIRFVIETHFHADHVSGRRRLADATGAVALVPSDPARPAAGGLHDADVLTVGSVQLRALAAPGHRPEHLAYLVTDARDPASSSLLSGDSVLIGDLARPDLAVDSAEGAHALWGTVRRLVALGEHVELWPGHVGGSLCGSGSLTDRRSSSIGEELRANRLLSCTDAEAFVNELTNATPARPPRVSQVVTMNVQGAATRGPLRELDASGFAQFMTWGASVIDIRSEESFEQGHLPGSLNLPAACQSTGTRAGWATSPDEAIVIAAPDLATGRRAATCLYSAGLWNLVGLTVVDLPDWMDAGLAITSAPALTPDELVPRLACGEFALLDVRDRREWDQGHLDQSVHMPLSELGDGCALEARVDSSWAVACASGRRAALAASLLRRRGHRNVRRLDGGVCDLLRHGPPLLKRAA
jgi:hydroxyacylglutathione hydrolase